MRRYLGYIYALLSALLNGTVGLFCVKILASGLSPNAISFYKCGIGLLIITSWLIGSGKFIDWLRLMRRLWKQLLVAAFFGFFVLYFFETAAYKYEKVTIVVFMLLGSALLTTFILSSILDRRALRLHDLASCLFALAGLSLIFGVNVLSSASYLGIFLALIGGVGYGVFLTIAPRLQIGSGLMVVNGLMLFGTLYLSIPFALEGFGAIPDMQSALFLLFTALLPTVGGFLLTTKALTLIRSESVQLLDLSEPIFAFLFSFIFLHQQISFWQMMGGLLLIASIYSNIAFSMRERSRLPH